MLHLLSCTLSPTDLSKCGTCLQQDVCRCKQTMDCFWRAFDTMHDPAQRQHHSRRSPWSACTMMPCGVWQHLCCAVRVCEHVISAETILLRVACVQEAALRHALQFPALQRLVYSTCSVYQRENEDVVALVLPAAAAAGFVLVDPFPSWHRRGLHGTVEGAEKLVRTDAAEDGTDGFFVAVFARKS
jgi:hypothetical protein